MQKKKQSNLCISASTPTRPVSPDHQKQIQKFALPGNLKLYTKLLNKENNLIDYQSLYALRYQVYCKEVHFLNPENYSDGLESDEFDPVSEHFLSRNPDSHNDAVGTVRLVRWSQQLAFPTVMHFDSLLEQLKRQGFPLDSTAEISRLCITKQYRRRANDGLLGMGSYTDNKDSRRKYPVILLELFKNMYLASKYTLGITHWIATFEDSLYRLLKRYGVHFNLLVPDEIDYYGKVRIYGASLQHLEEEMKMRRPELYAFFVEHPAYN